LLNKIFLVLILLTFACAKKEIQRESSNNNIPKVYVLNKNFPKEIRFDGKIFNQMFYSKENNLTILEYVPAGETIENFRNMITIQISNEDQKVAINSFIESSKELRTEDVRIYKNSQDDNLMIDCILFDYNRWIMEHNLIKYQKEASGSLLKIFFHTRIIVTNDIEKNMPIIKKEISDPRMNRIKELWNLKFPHS
jgi:hypothetical protein